MASTLALFPGSFDPFTNGHLDIVRTAARLFDRVEVAVGVNVSKQPLLSVDERTALIAQTVEDLGTVTVGTFDGLVVEYAREIGASLLVRGLRQAADFEYEQRMAVANWQLHPGLPTVFLTPHPVNLLVSSTLIRDIYRNGGDVSGFVPESVNGFLLSRRAG